MKLKKNTLHLVHDLCRTSCVLLFPARGLINNTIKTKPAENKGYNNCSLLCHGSCNIVTVKIGHPIFQHNKYICNIWIFILARFLFFIKVKI